MSESNGHHEGNGHHQNGDGKPSLPGGQGDRSGLTPSQQNIMVGMMLNPRRRWHVTKQAKRAAMAAILANLGSPDARVVNGAVTNLLKMEAQNQADQLKLLDKLAPDKHSHDHAVNIYLPDNQRQPSLNGTNGSSNGQH